MTTILTTFHTCILHHSKHTRRAYMSNTALLIYITKGQAKKKQFYILELHS